MTLTNFPSHSGGLLEFSVSASLEPSLASREHTKSSIMLEGNVFNEGQGNGRHETLAKMACGGWGSSIDWTDRKDVPSAFKNRHDENWR